MVDEPQSAPDWENSDNWDEFEWEQALKYSDDMAARYFRMLDRFGDLPNAEELIAARLGDQQLFEFEEGELEEDWAQPEGESSDESLVEEDSEESSFEERVGPGDSFYFESSAVYQRARQISLGWCNILASVLRPEDRFWGMKVLFYLGRLLSYLALSVGDGTYERIHGSIAFSKRALMEVNHILGEIDSKAQETPKYATMFKLIKDLLLENHDLIVAHLSDCRRRAEQES